MLLPAARSNSCSFLTAGPRSSRCSTESPGAAAACAACRSQCERHAPRTDLGAPVIQEPASGALNVTHGVDHGALAAKFRGSGIKIGVCQRRRSTLEIIRHCFLPAEARLQCSASLLMGL